MQRTTPALPGSRSRRASLRLLPAALLLAACDGPQSALDPAGRDAALLADLFWFMLVGAVVIWAIIIGLAFYASHWAPGAHALGLARALIVGGGIVFPTVGLAGLLLYAFPLMPILREPGPSDGVRISVVGERWWWRVAYLPPGAAEPIVSANEIRLPVGARTDVLLEGSDVIHSFWIPSLAGKLDMFPGRQTRFSLEPTRTGVFRGQCAEFCGASHALMAFEAVVMTPEDFTAWLEREAQPAAEPAEPLARRGKDVFLTVGCGACHAVRGTPAAGTFGPDLTHVGSRGTIGAGILRNDPEALLRWISHTPAIKPEVNMPAYFQLEAAELEALVAYLESLV